MKNANKEFKFRGPNKLLDFGNIEVADIAGVTVGVLQDVQEVEGLISNIEDAKCATQVNVCPALFK